MKEFRILIYGGARSTEVLIAPIEDLLKKEKEIKTLKIKLNFDYVEAYEFAEMTLNQFNPDIVICAGDRREIAAGAKAAFMNQIPIAHLYAGIKDEFPFATLDCVNRHGITLMADLAFCEDITSAIRVKLMWKIINKRNLSNIYNVGITHLDLMNPEFYSVKERPYVLALFNPLSDSKKSNRDLNLFRKELKKYEVFHKVIIGPNEDLDARNKINNLICKGLSNLTYYGSVEHNEFLGLLRNAEFFISNSSAAYYEAPHFLESEQIIIVGSRNRNRSTPLKLKTGASEEIIKILKDWWIRINSPLINIKVGL